MTRIVTFGGSQIEKVDLLAALTRFCTCEDCPTGHKHLCPGHSALLNDPTFSQRLVFVRRLRVLLTAQEFDLLEEP